MLLEILDNLKIEKVMAFGHSWGSMTIVRAAHKNQNRFLAIGLCNMPFKALTKIEISAIRFQHIFMFYRSFYMKQAGKALLGKESLKKSPDLINNLIKSMKKLSRKEIKYTDKALRIEANDATAIIESINIPIFAIIGEEDYVGIPPIIHSQTVSGGHVSPIEVPEEVNKFMTKLIRLAEET